MTSLWLSRARLKRDAPIATLAQALLPDREEDRIANGHRLIWSVFAGNGEPVARDFLWREDANGWFYILSRRSPPELHPVFEIDPPKPFAPALQSGDRLRFSLRANPTISRPLDALRTKQRDPALKPSRKTAHDDVVMRAIRTAPAEGRAEARDAAIQTEGRAWLERQGARCGFAVPRSPLDNDNEIVAPDMLRIDGYRVLRPSRPRKKNQMRIGVLDFDGVLTVSDPDVFLSALAAGFGRAKAYGCGLMLIRRA
jgi:CRISPR system Cascade subunit CasE